MIGWGAHFQVSGLSHQEPGTGDQVRVQEVCPLSSVIDSVLHAVLHSSHPLIANRFPLPPITLEQLRDGLAAVGDRHGAATGHEIL